MSWLVARYKCAPASLCQTQHAGTGLILQQTAILKVPSVPSMKAPRCVIYHRCRVCCSSSGSGGWGAEVGHKAYLEMSIPPTLATECGVPLDQKIPYKLRRAQSLICEPAEADRRTRQAFLGQVHQGHAGQAAAIPDASIM